MADGQKHDWRIDAGLRVLRGAGLFLAFTFGLQKFVGYVTLIRMGGSLSTSGLAPLIRAMGFPFPGFLAVYAVLSESVGALLIGLGLLTRISAVFGALSMAGAFYTSIRLGEEPLRAALYLVIFLALAVTGPGKYSLDFLLQSRKSNPERKRSHE